MTTSAFSPSGSSRPSGSGTSRGSRSSAACESLAIIELFKTQDMVAADVTRAQARVQSAAARVVQADRALRTGIITFNGNFEGLQQTSRFGDVLVLVNRPQEAVFALQLLKRGLRRVLHHGRRVQPGAVRAVPRAGLPGPRGRVTSGPPARSCRWTRRGRPTCPRWATGRPRPPAERQPSKDKDVGSGFLWSGRGLRPCVNARSQSFVPASSRWKRSDRSARARRRLPSLNLKAGSGRNGSLQVNARQLHWSRLNATKPNHGLPRVPHHEPEPVQQQADPPLQPRPGPSLASRCPARSTTCSMSP